MKKVVIVLIVLIIGLAICGCQELDINYEIDVCNNVVEKRSENNWFRFVYEDTVKFERMTDTNTLSRASVAIKGFSEIGEILAVKYQDEIYAIVARPVMMTGEYTVSIEDIKSAIHNNNLYLRISAKYIETDSNKSTPQIECYPFSIVKTDLKELPDVIEVYWMEDKEHSHQSKYY